jgi:hypothetical protein
MGAAKGHPMEEAETADEYLKMQLAMSKDTGWKDANALNGVVARSVLHEDLGRFKGRLHAYNLNDDARDRLLAHARQDAAHALCNTSSLLDQVKVLRRTMIVLIGLMIFSVLSVTALILFFH